MERGKEGGSGKGERRGKIREVYFQGYLGRKERVMSILKERKNGRYFRRELRYYVRQGGLVALIKEDFEMKWAAFTLLEWCYI